MDKQRTELRLVVSAPAPRDPPGDRGTPPTEQEWYQVRPIGEFYVRRVPQPSYHRGRYYPAGAFVVYQQQEFGKRGEIVAILSEHEFRRRFAITAEAEFVGEGEGDAAQPQPE